MSQQPLCELSQAILKLLLEKGEQTVQQIAKSLRKTRQEIERILNSFRDKLIEMRAYDSKMRRHRKIEEKPRNHAYTYKYALTEDGIQKARMLFAIT